MSRVPVTVLTGFLGAGKTTLLRSLLTQADGRRIAVIVNEFGDAGFDGGLVEECAAKACAPGDIVELTNGCICCTVADDFIPTMDKLLSRDRKLDAIVIETSGLALPQPLLKAFDWPAVRTRAFGYREAPGQVTHLIDESSVCVSHVKCLHELQARSARRRFLYQIGFQAAAISDDHKRTRCHGKSLAAHVTAHVPAIL